MAEPNCERTSTSAPPLDSETAADRAEKIREWQRERSDAIYLANLQSPGRQVPRPADYWEGPRPLNGLNNVQDLVEYLEGQRAALHMLDLAALGGNATKKHVRITRENTARLARKWGWQPPPENQDESTLEALDYCLQDLKSWCARQVAAPENSAPAPSVVPENATQQTARRRPRGTVNQRMIEAYTAEADRMMWTARAWAEYLGCGASSVTETSAWKECKIAREHGKENRKQQLKGRARNR